jgi:transcriptional regulator with XRE-family HTH domain
MAIKTETYGPRIREARLRAGHTQVALADLLSVDQRLLSKWETDRSEPSWSMLKRIALACHTSADAMLEIPRGGSVTGEAMPWLRERQSNGQMVAA